MKTKISILVGTIILLTSFRVVPTRTIMGKVTSKEEGSVLPGVNVVLKGTTTGTVTDGQGNYLITAPDQGGVLVFSFIGLQTKEVKIGTKNRIDVSLEMDVKQLSEVITTTEPTDKKVKLHERAVMAPKASGQGAYKSMDMAYQPSPTQVYEAEEQFNTEEYEGITENIFHDAVHSPLSTFSIDVDAASYSNIRRFIQGGQRPATRCRTYRRNGELFSLRLSSAPR